VPTTFYLKQEGVAAAQLIVTLVSIPLAAVAIGGLGLLAVFVWIVVDAFLIPGWIRGQNNLPAAQLGAWAGGGAGKGLSRGSSVRAPRCHAIAIPSAYDSSRAVKRG
jgi:TM2 domain-containing membrane protein YozV